MLGTWQSCSVCQQQTCLSSLWWACVWLGRLQTAQDCFTEPFSVFLLTQYFIQSRIFAFFKFCFRWNFIFLQNYLVICHSLSGMPDAPPPVEVVVSCFHLPPLCYQPADRCGRGRRNYFPKEETLEINSIVPTWHKCDVGISGTLGTFWFCSTLLLGHVGMLHWFLALPPDPSKSTLHPLPPAPRDLATPFTTVHFYYLHLAPKITIVNSSWQYLPE